MNTITTQIFYQHFLTGLQQNLQAELTDSDEISSGKKISKPSDDPAGLWQVVDYQNQISEIGQYQQAITTAKAPVQSLDTALSDLSNTLDRANELATSAGDGTIGASQRLMISDEVQQLFQSAVGTANTQVNGQYIFGGYQANTSPIDPATGELLSDSNPVNVAIANGMNVTTNIAAGSLFSFSRLNATDSVTNILPTYNWENYGANTIPDADPTSALETVTSTDPSAPTYTIEAGDSISINGTNVNLGASAGAWDANTFANKIQTAIQAQGGALANVSVTYDTTSNKFEIQNTGAAPVTVNWQGSAAPTPTSLNIEQKLGFSSVGDQTIAATNGVITSDNTVGKYTSSNDIFTQNGGSLDIKVGTNSTTSSAGFIINGTNDKIVIDGTTYTINNANNNNNDYYTGSSLASALSNLVPGVTFSYDGTAHQFTISNTDGAAHTVQFGGATTISGILGFNSTDSNFTSATSGASVTSDNTVGDVNLAAGSTLQDVRNAINTASAGVNAQVVNVGTSADPDFRVVVASNPVGSSADIDISVVSTTDPTGTGVNMLSYDQTTGMNMKLGTNEITNYNYITSQSTGNDSIVINQNENDQFVVQEAGYAASTVTIDPGTYTAEQLAGDIQTKLNAVAATDGSGNTYSVTYDPNAMKFKIAQTNAGGVAVNFTWSQWSSTNPTATQLLGFSPTTVTNASIAAGGGSVQSDNSVVANYYSFNNNYLNDKYVLRALNFENQSLINNDSGRISQSLQYLGDLTDDVSQATAVIGARENELNNEGNYQTDMSTNTQTYLSNVDDTDIAKASSDLEQRETALQALRTISAQVLNESLFDFIKFS